MGKNLEERLTLRKRLTKEGLIAIKTLHDKTFLKELSSFFDKHPEYLRTSKELRIISTKDLFRGDSNGFAPIGKLHVLYVLPNFKTKMWREYRENKYSFYMTEVECTLRGKGCYPVLLNTTLKNKILK
jgi:hypothetical protein